MAHAGLRRNQPPTQHGTVSLSNPVRVHPVHSSTSLPAPSSHHTTSAQNCTCSSLKPNPPRMPLNSVGKHGIYAVTLPPRDQNATLTTPARLFAIANTARKTLPTSLKGRKRRCHSGKENKENSARGQKHAQRGKRYSSHSPAATLSSHPCLPDPHVSLQSSLPGSSSAVPKPPPPTH